MSMWSEFKAFLLKENVLALAIAVVVGLGEVLGGVFSPTIAGRAADMAGLAAPLWIMFGR